MFLRYLVSLIMQNCMYKIVYKWTTFNFIVLKISSISSRNLFILVIMSYLLLFNIYLDAHKKNNNKKKLVKTPAKAQYSK